MFAIEVKRLNKQYKNGVKAINNLNLTVKKGEIFSLLGPNGAGKSSLINILTTFYKPTSGIVNILGKSIIEDSNFIRSQIACVSQKISIDEHLSLMENMIFQSRLYKVNPTIAKERINTLIDIFDLSSYLKYPTSSYSGGVKRRLDIAMNLVSFPKILFLDEPTAGMDVESRASMWSMILKIRKELGTTIFLTTHYLEEADFLSNTISIMKKGQIIAKGSKEDLSKYTTQNMIGVTFKTKEDAKKYKSSLNKIANINFITEENNTLILNLNDTNSFTSINKYLLDNNISFTKIEIMEPSLEDIFIDITNSNKMEVEQC